MRLWRLWLLLSLRISRSLTSIVSSRIDPCTGVSEVSVTRASSELYQSKSTFRREESEPALSEWGIFGIGRNSGGLNGFFLMEADSPGAALPVCAGAAPTPCLCM